MNQFKKDCPLSATEWINYLQNWKSQAIAIGLPQIVSLLTAFAFFGTLIYLAKLKENIVDNLILGKIDVANSYITILSILLIILFFIGLAIFLIINRLNSDMKKASDLIQKIIEGEDNSNKIRGEWKERFVKPEEKRKMEK